MAATPGQAPPGSGPGQQSVPSMVGIPSTVQRVEVAVNAVSAGSGTSMVRVSQGTTAGSVVGGSMVTRPQIVTTTPGTIFQTPVGNLQSLGLMVTRFPAGDHTRPQIILQSRSGGPVRSGPVVVTSTTGGQLIHQTPLARGPVGTGGIRTAIVHSGSLPPGTVAVPGHGHGVIGSTPSGSSGTIQVMNLSAVPSTISGTSGSQVTKLNQVQQQAGTTFISRFGGQTFDGQTVNFILSDTNRGAIRLSSDLIKTVQPGGKYPRVQSGIPSTPKIVNLGPPVSGTPMGVTGSMGGVTGSMGGVSGSMGGAAHPPQVTRLNIIHSGSTHPGSGHPMVVGSSTLPSGHSTQLVGGHSTQLVGGHSTQLVGVGKQGGVINIAPVGTSKQGSQQTVILNPATNQFMTASPGGKIGGQGVKTTVVAMNQGGGMIGGQSMHGNHPSHTVINASALRGITTVPSSIGTVPSSIGTVPSSIPGPTIVSHGIVSSSIHRHPSIVAMNASPIKTSTSALIGGHVQSSVTGSPIKGQSVNPVHAQTPPSPRPSILTRKRNLGDVPLNQSNLGKSPIKTSLAEGLAAKVEAELVTSENDHNRPLTTSNLLPCTQSNILSAQSNILSAQSNILSAQSTMTSQPVSVSSDGTATPRKKPRKQSLEPFNLSTSANMKLLTATGSSDEGAQGSHFGTSSNVSKEGSKRQVDPEDGDDLMVRTTEVDPVLGKKFRPALYQSVIPPWKSLQHHFLRYTDVKPRPEKRMTLAELSNEGLQKKNGWKIHHLATQMEEMGEDEAQVLDRLRKLLAVLEEKSSVVPSGTDLKNGSAPTQSGLNGTAQSDLNRTSVGLQTPEKVIDLIRGNLQRSNIFKEQMNESQQLLVKLTNDHREKVAKLTKKNMHKRTCIAK